MKDSLRFDEVPLKLGGKYAIKHTTRNGRALVKELRYRLDPNSLNRDETASCTDAVIFGAVPFMLCYPWGPRALWTVAVAALPLFIVAEQQMRRRHQVSCTPRFGAFRFKCQANKRTIAITRRVAQVIQERNVANQKRTNEDLPAFFSQRTRLTTATTIDLLAHSKTLH